MPRKAPDDHYRNYCDRHHAKRRRQSGMRLIPCAICGEPMLLINANHLKTHAMTQAEYKALFPAARTCSPDMIKKRTQTKTANLYGPITLMPQVRSLLVGSLLGDGFLECAKLNARYKEQSPKEEYMVWKAEMLKQSFAVRVRRDTLTDRRSNRVYKTYRIATHAHPVLTEWHSRWYPDGRKIVARQDVQTGLDSLALAIWFYDDGHLVTRKRDYRAYLYTMAFSLDDTKWLAALLRDRFGLGCQTMLLKCNGRDKPVIVFPREARDRLIEVISQHPAPGMEYKLNLLQPTQKRRQPTP